MLNVMNMQTIPATREVAYREHEKASRACRQAEKAGASPERLKRLRDAEQIAWTQYREWVEADSFAARAGAYDHLDGWREDY